MEPAIREVYRKFQKLDPEAVYPALYIVIGRCNSGGMSSPRALILGGVKSYGDGHEHELWQQFQEDIQKPDRHRGWLYNGGDANRVGPPDLGKLVKMDDPARILKLSRYGERFGASGQSKPASTP